MNSGFNSQFNQLSIKFIPHSLETLAERYYFYLLEQEYKMQNNKHQNLLIKFSCTLESVWKKIIPQTIRGPCTEYQFLMNHIKRNFKKLHRQNEEKLYEVKQRQLNNKKQYGKAVLKQRQIFTKQQKFLKESKQKILKKSKTLLSTNNIQTILQTEKFTLGLLYTSSNILALKQIILSELLDQVAQKLKLTINIVEVEETRNNDWFTKLSELRKQIQEQAQKQLNQSIIFNFNQEFNDYHHQIIDKKQNIQSCSTSQQRMFPLRQFINPNNLNNRKLETNLCAVDKSNSNNNTADDSSTALKILNKQNQQPTSCYERKNRRIGLQNLQSTIIDRNNIEKQLEHEIKIEQQQQFKIEDLTNDPIQMQKLCQSQYFEEITPQFQFPMLVPLCKGLQNQLIVLDYMPIYAKSYEEYSRSYAEYLIDKIQASIINRQKLEQQIINYAQQKRQQCLKNKEFLTQKALMQTQ